MPRVSIVTPTYNHAAYIGECIESVLAQTYGDWEMLIVNDGSTDGTADIVHRYDDPRIRFFEKPNGGIMRLAESYNLALVEAKGEFLAILEGDDYWPPNKLALQVPAFDDPDVVLVSGFAQIVDETMNELGRIPHELMSDQIRNNRPLGETALAMMLPFMLNFTFPVATMLRRATVERIGGFRQTSGLPLVDYPTFLALTMEGEFRFVQRTCGYWRRHSTSVTSSRMPAIFDGCYREVMSFLKEDRVRRLLPEKSIRDIVWHWESFQAKRLTLLAMILASEGNLKGARKALTMSNRFQRSKKSRVVASFANVVASTGLSIGWAYSLSYRSKSHDRAKWEDAMVEGKGPVVRGEDIENGWPVIAN